MSRRLSTVNLNLETKVYCGRLFFLRHRCRRKVPLVFAVVPRAAAQRKQFVYSLNFHRAELR